MNMFKRQLTDAARFGRTARPAPAPVFNPDARRRSLLGKVHLASKEIGHSRDDYEAILLRVAGKTSAADCTEAELIAVIDDFKAKGWKPVQPAGKRGPRPADHPGAGKARAMWISLHHLGAIHNPSEQALEAFAKRQLKCERLQWADQSLTYRLIEALKAIAERNGWRQDLAGVMPDAAVIVLKRRLVEAILEKLRDAGLAPADWAIDRAAREFAGMDVRYFSATASELDILARVLGDKLRTPAAPIGADEVIG